MQARFKALNVFIEANPGYAYASAGGFGAAIALAHWSLTADSRRRKKEAEEETRRVEAERHRQMMRAAAEMDRNINTWLKEMKLRNGFRDMEEKLRLLHSTYEEQNQRLEGLLADWKRAKEEEKDEKEAKAKAKAKELEEKEKEEKEPAKSHSER